MAVNTLQLRQEMGRTVDEANVILDLAVKENRGLTDAERAQVDEKKARVASLKSTIATAEEFGAMGEGLEAPATRGQHTGTGVEVHNNAEDAPFANLGEFLLCVRSAAIQPSAIDPRLQKRAALGANEKVGSEGGFLVGKDQSAQLLEDMHDVGVLAPLCEEIPISSQANGTVLNGVDETSRVDGSRWGGVRAYWADEAEAATASKPKFNQIEMKLKKLLALLYATDELLADASALARVGQRAFSEEMAFKLDDAIIRGTGAGQPLGILNAPVLVSVAKESGQSAGTIVFENIVKMYARMPARSKARAAWFVNDDVMPQLQLMTIAAGAANVPVYLPPGGASQAPFGTIFGRPVIPIEQAATVGTQGDIMLADFKQYLLATKGGVQQASSIHVQFLTAESVFRWMLRVDGQPARRSPITPFKGSATKGPFVVLDTRA